VAVHLQRREGFKVRKGVYINGGCVCAEHYCVDSAIVVEIFERVTLLTDCVQDRVYMVVYVAFVSEVIHLLPKVERGEVFWKAEQGMERRRLEGAFLKIEMLERSLNASFG